MPLQYNKIQEAMQAEKKSIKTLQTTTVNLGAKSEVFRIAMISNAIRVSLLRPIYKNGKGQQCENYRPRAILPELLCVLEELMHKNAASFCEKFDVFFNVQYDFRC